MTEVRYKIAEVSINQSVIDKAIGTSVGDIEIRNYSHFCGTLSYSDESVEIMRLSSIFTKSRVDGILWKCQYELGVLSLEFNMSNKIYDLYSLANFR